MCVIPKFMEFDFQVSAVLNGFMEHISRDKTLVKSHGPAVVSCLISYWAQLAGWWEGTFEPSRRLAAVSLLKKMIVVDPEVRVNSCSCVLSLGHYRQHANVLSRAYWCMMWGIVVYSMFSTMKPPVLFYCYFCPRC